MANTVSSGTWFGFQEFQRREGGSPTMGMTQVWIASTDASLIFRGDPVITSSGGGTNLSGNYVTGFTSGNTQIRGIFQGCEQFLPAVGNVRFLNNYSGAVTGSTGDVKAWIIDDPQREWLVQGSSTQAITSSMVGLNAGFTANSSLGNTITGMSVVALQSTTIGSTNALAFRILDFYSNWAVPGINGVDNTTAGNMVIVGANNWDRSQLTARSS